MADVQQDLAVTLTDPEARIDLTDFEDFKSLPIELRLAIWKLR
jgi:hypothetical protein